MRPCHNPDPTGTGVLSYAAELEIPPPAPRLHPAHPIQSLICAIISARMTGAIAVSCQCGRQLNLQDKLAGKRIRCPACGAALDVPRRAIVLPDQQAVCVGPPPPPSR